MSEPSSTLHASAVLVGARALLIRGRSGSGKSRLAFALIAAAQTGALGFARLVGDDRVLAEAANGQLLVRPAPNLAGLIEMRGLGLRIVPYEPVAAVGALIDLAAKDGTRLPEPASREGVVAGVRLPRLAIAAEADPVPVVLAYLTSQEAVSGP